jgi:hypothetical protein
MGFSPDITAGVWVGNNDDSPMTTEAVDIAAPVWHDYMVNALSSFSASDNFKRPSGIKSVTLDRNTGKLATPGSRTTDTDLFPSWYVAPANNQSAKVDKVSGMLATSCTPPLATETLYSAGMNAEIPPSDPEYKLWQPPVEALAQGMGYQSGGGLPTTYDNVHNCGDTKPSVTLTANTTDGGTFHITATATAGTFPLQSVAVTDNGQTISTGNGTLSFEYSPTTNGTHTLQAEVIDTGYYNATDTTPIDVTNAGAANFSGTAPAEGSTQNPGVVNFNWSQLDGASTYKLIISKNGTPIYTSSPTGSTSTLYPLGPGSYSWQVTAYDSSNSVLASSNSISFTVGP